MSLGERDEAEHRNVADAHAAQERWGYIGPWSPILFGGGGGCWR